MGEIFHIDVTIFASTNKFSGKLSQTNYYIFNLCRVENRIFRKTNLYVKN